MAKREIFLKREINCPSCKEITEYKYPNPRLYVAARRDTDMRVIEYRWGEGIEENTINPHHYDIWQCPKCMYADFMDHVINSDLRNQSLSAIRAYKDLTFERRRLLTELKSALASSEDMLMQAFNTHLAALFINYLPEKENRNHNKIGRIALRVSWLFKEHGGLDIDDTESEQQQSKYLEALDKDSSNLEAQLLTVRDTISELAQHTEARLEELGIAADNTTEDNPYTPLVNSFTDKLEEMKTLNTMLQRTLLSDKRQQFSEEEQSSSMSDDAEVTDVLMNLKKFWAEMPVNENQAVHKSIEAFDYSYNHENYYQSIEQSMSVVALIVDLYSRIGEHNEALSYVGEIYRSGMRMKQELQSRINSGRKNDSLSPHDERMINRKIGNINTAIRQAGDKRRELLKVVLKKLTPRINKILAAVSEASYHEQVLALKKNEIPEEIIYELKNRGILQKEKKKGLFGLGG